MGKSYELWVVGGWVAHEILLSALGLGSFDSRFLILDSRFLFLVSQFSILNSRFSILDSQFYYQVPGPRSQVPGPKSQSQSLDNICNCIYLMRHVLNSFL